MELLLRRVDPREDPRELGDRLNGFAGSAAVRRPGTRNLHHLCRRQPLERHRSFPSLAMKGAPNRSAAPPAREAMRSHGWAEAVPRPDAPRSTGDADADSGAAHVRSRASSTSTRSRRGMRACSSKTTPYARAPPPWPGRSRLVRLLRETRVERALQRLVSGRESRDIRRTGSPDDVLCGHAAKMVASGDPRGVALGSAVTEPPVPLTVWDRT